MSLKSTGSRPKGRFVTLPVTIAMLTACSSGALQGVPTAGSAAQDLGMRPPSAQASCSASKVFVGDYAANAVFVFPQGVNNPKHCSMITTGVSGPEALYADAKGALYVANYATSSITVYSRGARTPRLTIPTAAPPYDVFVGVDGIVYSAQATSNTVEEFAANSTTPLRTLSINGGPHGVATDNANNLYVSYLSNSDGMSHVEEFAPGATTGTDLGIVVSFAGELKLDTQNDIILGDRNNHDTIYIYPPGQSNPSRSITTPGGNPVSFALDKTETLLYVDGLYTVEVIDYQSGAPVAYISAGLRSPQGIALYPPAPY